MRVTSDLQVIDLFVSAGELTETVAKLISAPALLDFNLSSKCFELIYVLRSILFLYCQHLDIELLLVNFLQERNQKLGCAKHLRFKYAVEESLVVARSLHQLPWI